MANRKSERYDFDEWDLWDSAPEGRNRHEPAATGNERNMDWAGYTEEELVSRRNESNRGRKIPAERAAFRNRRIKLFWGLAAVAVILIVGIGLLDYHTDRNARKGVILHTFPEVLDVPENTALEEMDPPEQQVTSESVSESIGSNTETTLTDTTPDAGPKEYRYYGRKLSETERQAYDILSEALLAQEETIDGIRFSTEESIGRVMEAIYFDYAELYWYTGQYSYVYFEQNGLLDVAITPTYNCTPAERVQRQAFVEEKIRELLDELYWESEYEKVKGVYEFLIDNTAYDYEYFGKTMYELLNDGRAVCDAYARAMQYILTRLDVEIIYVTGESGSLENREAHSWNIVKIDGEYYQIDATWGDPYYEDGTQTKNFIYFCVTDAEIGRNHWAERKDYPACTATKYNYFIYEGRFLDSNNTNLLKQWMRESEIRGKPLSFKMANEQLYQEVKTKLIDEGEIFSLMEEVLGKTVPYFYSQEDDFYILTIIW